MKKRLFVAQYVPQGVGGDDFENACYLAKGGRFVFDLQEAATFADPEKAIAAGNDALGALLNRSPDLPRACEVRRGWVIA